MKMERIIKISFISIVFLTLTLTLGVSPSVASSLGVVKDAANNIQDRSTFHGFLQQSVAVNTENVVETEQDDKWRASMIRSSLFGEIQTDMDWSLWTVKFRYDLEYPTSYGEHLQEMTDAKMSNTDHRAEVEEFELREWYGDFNIGDRWSLRLGKQQVVWGKTDFFSGMDIVNGYNFRWRSFLEPENEQTRKGLIMANLIADIPEADGNLQIICRPGVDRNKDIGNSYDLYGGRWATQPYRGTDFLDKNHTLDYNLDHKEGEQDDPTYGIRWSGRALGMEYSLNYLHSFWQDPSVNPSETALGAYGAKHYKEEPSKGVLGDFFYKQVDLLGFTTNYYVAPLDIIVRSEVSYTWDAPYNYGQDFAYGTLPGFGGIKEKDTVRMMFAFDKNVRFPMWMLGSARPGFLNMQIFDTWIVDHDDKDDLVFGVGYGKERKEHEMIATAVLSWYYDYDRIVPQIAGGVDATNGGGFLIPSVKFAYGDNWRLLVEYDMFFGDGKQPGEVEDSAAMFDYFDDKDQIYIRLTYQF